MQTTIISTDDPSALPNAVIELQKGGLVAFPTDTVYGLGALFNNPSAIEQLFRVKGRESAKAIAILVGNPSDVGLISSFPNQIANSLAKRFWPGPLTLVVSSGPDLPSVLSPLPTIGIRMPDHPTAIKLLELSGPLAVTSANISGGPNATTAQEVFHQLKGLIPLILDGGSTPGGQPSTVVDCLGEKPVIIRRGPIHLEELLEATS